MLKIAVTTPKGNTSQIECTIDSCSIGKSDENLIALQGWTVAKKHAAIKRRPEGVYLEDLGSSSGTEVNGRKISGQHGPLHPGDKIAIAGYTLEVLDLELPVAAATPATPAAGPAAVSPAPTLQAPPAPAPAAAAPPPPPPSLSEEARETMTRHLKRVHQLLIKQMDLRRMDVSRQSEDELRTNTRALLEEIVLKDNELPPEIDRQRVIKQVLDEVVGLGPLEDLLADELVTEIMVNRFDEIFIERSGRLTKSDITFTSDLAVVGAIERIVAPLGRRIDESSPMVDARLKDGSRVNAVIPPLALKGANITIRKFSKKKLQGEDMVRFGSMTHEMLGFMKTVVEQKANMIISGGTGSGKTTLLNLLSSFIPPDERIITVEDAAELQLSQPNLIGLESRPANAEGKGLVAIRDLVKNTLRMRPDRIVVGECRGGEALDMLTAMNTGHDGSLTTAHANTPRDCLARLEVMVMMSGLDLPVRAIREQIASAIRFFIQQNRFSCGSRKITHITEVTGMEGEVISLQDIFLFKQEGFGADGKVKGKHIATGAIPDFYQDLKNRGLDVDLSVFQAGRVL
ncbi:ATPase, T2SS/T4P/T4SS family [Sulfuritalea hydrogenivorans]|jgi:pilus assembly protein CpaF|uniref:FHA domain-containing protein n=1 Tax=Sulfuritalea hydrogenivorans sk43H TaxID=1223802 RepID=W0SGM0_9PROT|nr:ATPase, T2SS/T4P/T4SS family [Sulfuritalea hydrogenivorans]MDK9712875.1 ATPase, T2SS/T4P/T4SS family [Sulfuritalea sp.]BAO30186.1 FHA domain-containing protein [Sulfuritalea hydrogenivorans sk43H]